MIAFAALVLALAAFAAVGYPLLKPRQEIEPAEDDILQELSSKKDATYSAIKELQFDYDLGNLTPADHRDIEEKYKDKAVGILKEIDAQKRGKKIEDDLEREIMKHRGPRAPALKRVGAQKGRGAEDDLEREILRRRGERGAPVAAQICPKCGSKARPQAKFCPKCGSSLALRCPKCNTGYQAGDAFCSQCGASLSQEVKE